jgi:hypothetical protein
MFIMAFYALMCICWFWLPYIIDQCAVLDHLKLINSQQAKTTYSYKNTKQKLHRTNAAIWFNKMCRLNHWNYEFTFVHWFTN